MIDLIMLTQQERNYISNIAPRDTGNLADNALGYRPVSELKTEILINTETAPYQKYLEYGTMYSTKHKGWFKNSAKLVAKDVALKTNGMISTETIINRGWND